MGTEKEKQAFVKARDASTVILLRDQDEGQFEVLLMARTKEQKFMGGAYVFPGGGVEEDDCSTELATFAEGVCDNSAKARLNEFDISGEVALGIHFAAIREMFEEAGVLLAYHANGDPLDLSEADIYERFKKHRQKHHENCLCFKELAREEHITYALDMLIPYSHWITPEPRPKRYDTRFFLAKIPDGQAPVHDEREMTATLWITPGEALERGKAKEIGLPPPTLKSIEELNEFTNTGEALEAARKRELYTILPQPFAADGAIGVKLPHDPEYTIERFKRPHRPGEVSRIQMKDGMWKTIVHTPEQ